MIDKVSCLVLIYDNRTDSKRNDEESTYVLSLQRTFHTDYWDKTCDACQYQ